MENLKESDLYEPVKAYLDSLGYDTKGEVKDCDIAAVRDGTLIVVELKKGFTIELLYQAVRRMAVADSVYVAVPLPKGGYNAPRYDDMVRLCRRLEIGLLLVGFTESGKAQIDPVVHPAPAKAVRRNAKKRAAVLNEHGGRTGSKNTGGVTRRKILTVYKEKALKVAVILSEYGELKVREIRKYGGPENTSVILKRNFYSWYEKVDADLKSNFTYRITDEGLSALIEYKDLLD